jgi:hypothetical protein
VEPGKYVIVIVLPAVSVTLSSSHVSAVLVPVPVAISNAVADVLALPYSYWVPLGACTIKYAGPLPADPYAVTF